MLQSPAIRACMVLLLAAAPACNTGRRSSAGFRLPPDGDVERGKIAFTSLGCIRCHDVSGAELPGAPARIRPVMTLGGEVGREPGDGRLVRAIVWPSVHPRSGIVMPRTDHEMTVRQLTDIVAFLQSQYKVRVLPPQYGAY